MTTDKTGVDKKKKPFTVEWLQEQHAATDRKRRDFADKRTPGLYVRVAPSGLSWWFRTSSGGVPRRISLGVYPELKLADARRIAQSAADVLRRGVAEPDAIWVLGKRIEYGIDVLPIAEPRPPRSIDRWTFAQGRDAFLVEVARTRRPATHRSYGQFLRHPSLRALESRPVADISRQEMAKIVAQVHRDIGETQSRNMAAAIRPMWTYLAGDHVVENSGVLPEVMEKLKAPERSRVATGKRVERDPALESVGRLLAVARSGLLRPVLGAAIELVVLTAQRRLTVVSARRSFIRSAGEHLVWVMPPENLKSGESRTGRSGEPIPEHELPLAAPARAVVERMLATETDGDWLFPQVRPRRKGDQVSHLHESSLTHAIAEVPDVGFSPHDLRRALTSTLRAAGYPRESAAILLDHAEGRAGVTTRHYDRYRELDEKAEKLGVWTAAVEAAAAIEATRLDLPELREHLRMMRLKRAPKARTIRGRPGKAPAAG